MIIEFGFIFQRSLPGSLPSVASPKRDALALLPPTEEVFLFFLAARAPPTVVEVFSPSVSPWWSSSKSLLSEPGRLLSRARRAQHCPLAVPWWLLGGSSLRRRLRAGLAYLLHNTLRTGYEGFVGFLAATAGVVALSPTPLEAGVKRVQGVCR